MIQISTGDSFEHTVYGDIEVTGFITVSDEIEINELERNGSRELDVVCSVQSDNVLFIDTEGREHKEPLENFYDHVELSD